MDYDELRRQNIAKRQAVFAEFFKDLKTESQNLKEHLAHDEKTGYMSDATTKNPPSKKKRQYRKKNFQLEFKRTYRTRQRASKNSNDDVVQTDDDHTDDVKEKEDNTDVEIVNGLLPNGRSLKIIFPWATTFDHEMESMIKESIDLDNDL